MYLSSHLKPLLLCPLDVQTIWFEQTTRKHVKSIKSCEAIHGLHLISIICTPAIESNTPLGNQKPMNFSISTFALSMSAEGSVAELPPITITNSPFLGNSRRWSRIRCAISENHANLVKTAMTMVALAQGRPRDSYPPVMTNIAIENGP